jgi:hypothetical protein
VITLDQFKDTLSEIGYYCELLELQTLLKRLDISHEMGIDYKKFMNDLVEKNAAWWKKNISSNGFELTAKGKRNGNYRPLCNKAVYSFIANNLGEIAKQAIHKAGYLSTSEFVEEIFQERPRGISKRDLRKELLEKEIPLARLDTHILFTLLEETESQVIKKEDFKKFIENQKEFMLAKGKDGEDANIWIKEETGFARDSLGNKPNQRTSPTKLSKSDEEKVSKLELSIKEKNKLIIQLEKDVEYYKEIAAHKKAPSESYSKEINTLEKENRDLNRKLKESEDKYISDKKRLEQIIKENISTPHAGDFILLQKKIEMLEQSLYERKKDLRRQVHSSSQNTKDKKEIKQLKEQIEADKSYYLAVIEKKNQEIKTFREELNIMLEELEEVKNQNFEKERLFMQNKSNLISN